MKSVCVLLVLLMCVYHDARYRKRKVCVGMFMICFGTTLLMPSPTADVASQFDN